MTGDTEWNTSPTLLGRLRRSPTDETAWSNFNHRYGRLIHSWCRRWGMQPSDAQDMTQDILLQLSKQMNRFQYDANRRFRSWLKTVAYRAWCDFLEHQNRRKDAASGGSGILQLLNSQEVCDDFLLQFEEEWKRELLEQALKMVQQRVQPHTWEAFRLMTQDGMAGPEVAKRMNMKIGAVWVAKSKVQKMIQEEIGMLKATENAEAD